MSLKIAPGVPALKRIPSRLTKIIVQLAEREGIDYIIYDLSSNVGGLNEVALMSSNFFIVPTSPGYFCLQAVGSLTHHIKEWHKEIEEFNKVNAKNDSESSIRNRPCFIGAIHQRYRPKSGKPAKSFQIWMDQIKEEIEGNFVTSLLNMDKNCAVGREKMEGILEEPYDLAQISDFNSLIAISQKLSKPVCSVI